MSKKINIKQKFSKFSDLWSPKVIAEMNDYQFKIVKIHGEFVWHKHDETDEVFIVIEGSMKIQFRKKTINTILVGIFLVGILSYTSFPRHEWPNVDLKSVSSYVL